MQVLSHNHLIYIPNAYYTFILNTIMYMVIYCLIIPSFISTKVNSDKYTCNIKIIWVWYKSISFDRENLKNAIYLFRLAIFRNYPIAEPTYKYYLLRYRVFSMKAYHLLFLKLIISCKKLNGKLINSPLRILYWTNKKKVKYWISHEAAWFQSWLYLIKQNPMGSRRLLHSDFVSLRVVPVCLFRVNISVHENRENDAWCDMVWWWV